MATVEPHVKVRDGALSGLLARLRARIRAYIWADGVAATVAVLCAAFWLSLIVDWMFELPRPLRIVALIGAAVTLLYVIAYLLIGRLAVRMNDRNMAVLLERRFSQFRDSLLTSVELEDAPEHAESFNRDMLEHTRREALSHAQSIDVGAVLDARPLARRVTLAAALGLAALTFALVAPDAFRMWFKRDVLLSNERWPRKTHLLVAGFDENGHRKIARGADLDLAVQAKGGEGRVVPSLVEVRYRTDDGARGRENMSQEGVLSLENPPLQNFAHTFKSVLSGVEFYVQGGDAREGPFHLDVVDSPTISRMALVCQYPAYMNRQPRTIPVAGVMEIPRGTQITLKAEANKPLVSVQIDDVSDATSPDTTRLDVAVEAGAPPTEFEHQLTRLDADRTLLFVLKDADGIRSREAVRLSLRAVADEPPQVHVQLKGIGTALTANAQLPAVGEVTDDYGVYKIWFEYHADNAPPHETPLSIAAHGEEKLVVSEALEVRELGLEPKQRFHWTVQAADGFTLDSPAGAASPPTVASSPNVVSSPNIGTAQRYVLDVVTPEQLRSMLEARELMLRRRFEVIIDELTDTRSLLASIDMKFARDADASAEREAGTGKADEVSGAASDISSATRGLATSVQVERVLQNAQRNAHETLQVASAFDDIRAELINNRLDTEELKARLKDAIADPLRYIGGTMFPAWETDLKKLTSQLADQAAATSTQAAALAQCDAILNEMKQVLNKMLELETFNEVLDMLREIIAAQDKVNTDTKQRQRARLQDLVE